MKKLLVFLFCLVAAYGSAQAQHKTRILFLLDGSGSMYAKMQNETRIDHAIARLADPLEYESLVKSEPAPVGVD